MRILIVKLSSLGDVVHAMPAVQDIRSAFPDVTIDWVVERGFAPLVRRCHGVQGVIACELRRWSKSPLSAQTRHEWRTFRRELRGPLYHAVIDLQGLTKSALVARAARLLPGGKRYALANQTDGAGYEAPTRWVADVAIRIQPHVHAVTRSRELCARALGFAPEAAVHYGLQLDAAPLAVGAPRRIAFLHGTSRDDKCWPEASWIALARRLVAQGFTIGLPHGSDDELDLGERIAHAVGPAAQVWPRLDLGQLTDRLGACAGAIGVDSGLSHIAVALDLPHVQIYNFDTAWRTGPLRAGDGPQRQLAVYAEPTPSVDDVWRAWEQARTAS
ncbi:MAG: lipopolysaccharide heptosyltransferase I [Ramlibacter sp.]